GMVDGGTASLRDEDRDEDASRRALRAGPSLVLVMNAANPLEPPACIPLAAIDEVILGRGPARRVSEAGPRAPRVDLADAAAPSSDARLTRGHETWRIVDEQSKNGTLVNGLRVARTDLGPHDLIEIGSSFFLVRPGTMSPGPGLPAMRTLNTALAQELRLLA